MAPFAIEFITALGITYTTKHCIRFLYFSFFSLRVVTNLANEHRINEAKLIRLCHTLDKNKKKKKDIYKKKMHKLLQASSVLDKTKASSSLHGIFEFHRP